MSAEELFAVRRAALEAGRHGEALACFEEMITRFLDDAVLTNRAWGAWALVRKADALDVDLDAHPLAAVKLAGKLFQKARVRSIDMRLVTLIERHAAEVYRTA
jgi:hypothetical protein